MADLHALTFALLALAMATIFVGIPSNPKAQGQIIAILALLSAVAFTVLAVIGVS